MRNPATMLGSLVIATFIFVNTGQSANAEPVQQQTSDRTTTALRQALVPATSQSSQTENIQLVEIDKTAEADASEQEAKEKKQTLHEVKRGESLTKIAKKYETTWKRVWDKNEQLVNPDIILVSDKLYIPEPGEKLEEREVPRQSTQARQATSARQAASARQATRARQSTTAVNGGSSATSRSIDTTTAPRQQAKRVQPKKAQPVAAPRRANSPNTYAAGNCTWYAKSRRPDIPSNLGNANTWAQRARAQGMSVGSTPRVGAIAATTSGSLGHVAYVERVNSNGTVFVSEMNWKGLYVTSTRTAPASSFTYIY